MTEALGELRRLLTVHAFWQSHGNRAHWHLGNALSHCLSSILLGGTPLAVSRSTASIRAPPLP